MEKRKRLEQAVHSSSTHISSVAPMASDEGEVSILGVVFLWGECRDIPKDQGVIVKDLCYISTSI